MKRISLLSLVILLLSVSSSFATDYYVDGTYGVDDASCISSPGVNNECATCMYVVNNATLSGGDTVYIQSGTYTENITITTTDDGSDGNYVIFKTYGNEDVTIRTTSSSHPVYVYEAGATVQYVKFDGRGNDSGKHLTITTTTATRCMIVRRANYIWLTGIKFHNAQGASGHGLYFLSQEYGTDSGGSDDDNGPKNCIIEYSEFYNNGGHGFKLTGWGTDTNTIRYCDMYQNGTSHSGDQLGMNISGSGYAANPPTGNIVHHSNFYNNYGNAITILYAPNTEFYENYVYENGDDDNDGVCENATARGVTISTDSNNCKIYNNHIYDNCYYNLILSDADSNLVYNNLIYGSDVTDVVVDSAALNNKFYNNSIYGTSTSGYTCAFYIKNDGSTGTILKNNFIYHNGSAYAVRSLDSGTVEDNDLYAPSYAYMVEWGGSNYSSIATFNSTEAAASNNISEDPSWDGSYKLTSSTQSGIDHVRDGGQDLSEQGFSTDKYGVTRPIGSAWDIGAHEYDFGMPPTAPTNLRIVPCSY